MKAKERRSCSRSISASTLQSIRDFFYNKALHKLTFDIHKIKTVFRESGRQKAKALTPSPSETKAGRTSQNIPHAWLLSIH